MTDKTHTVLSLFPVRNLVIKKILCFVVLLSALTFSGFAQEETQEELLGDGNDGNSSGIVHVITLFDEKGLEIKPDDPQPRPVSMKNTCGECHNYDHISDGWHFNSANESVPAGRPGEPWVLSHYGTRTQIPVSNRGWEGTYKPEDIELSPWKMLREFASHNPGGNYGEMSPADDDMEADPVEFLRWPISGHYEINCLACHNADPRQHQSDGALQAARQNYRWIATVAAELATVTGTASELDEFYDPEFEYEIKTSYDEKRFDEDNKVFLDIVRKPLNDNCYFCHSTQDTELSEELTWTAHEDIHLTSGMSCVDCHRNGADHMIARGDIELSNGDVNVISSVSCRGCHLGDETSIDPEVQLGGHMGAPHPEHAGIPPVHFSLLSCTACHSGPLPEDEAGRLRTSRIHKLGLHGRHQQDKQLPHVLSPVFVKGEDGKIAPHRLFWPSFWGIKNGDDVKPLLPEFIEDITGDALTEGMDTPADDWRPLTDEQIVSVLNSIASTIDAPTEGETQAEAEPEAIYVAGGRTYRLVDGELEFESSEIAEAYSWPLAHNVRPASQSLGANGNCADCHDTQSPFFFGFVEADSPAISQYNRGVVGKGMTEFEELDRDFARTFATSFVFRPWMKLIVLISCAVLGLLLLAYGARAVSCISEEASTKDKES